MSAESPTSTPVRSIWEELETWSKGFAPWQRLLLAVAVRSGKIPQSTLEQAYALFLAEYDLAKSHRLTTKSQNSKHDVGMPIIAYEAGLGSRRGVTDF